MVLPRRIGGSLMSDSMLDSIVDVMNVWILNILVFGWPVLWVWVDADAQDEYVAVHLDDWHFGDKGSLAWAQTTKGKFKFSFVRRVAHTWQEQHALDGQGGRSCPQV
ncbi:hypothetical protein N7490_011798 [Penicillium lividum]|nr:hypothetical protein N7490_011798 [Penicillium lividum]